MMVEHQLDVLGNFSSFWFYRRRDSRSRPNPSDPSRRLPLPSRLDLCALESYLRDAYAARDAYEREQFQKGPQARPDPR